MEHFQQGRVSGLFAVVSLLEVEEEMVEEWKWEEALVEDKNAAAGVCREEEGRIDALFMMALRRRGGVRLEKFLVLVLLAAAERTTREGRETVEVMAVEKGI